MKYTYQISFNTSDYVALIPNEVIEMDGFWEEGTMIWRENISELKITKAENSTIYDTLESWFDDSDYFASPIFVKILKNNVQESIHWFGVKWGTINKELKTYTVQPIAYDLWGQYFEATKDVPYVGAFIGVSPSYYETTGTYALIASFISTCETLEDAIKTIASDICGWTSTDVVSSFLWQDAYENASAVGTYRGIPLDYVTGVESYLTKATLQSKYKTTFSDMLTLFSVFRTFCFFDSNDKLRFEHISFFNDKLSDNAVDYSDYLEAYDEEWNYENTSMPTIENISMQDNNDGDLDFGEITIEYSDISNRPDAEKIDNSFSYYSDIEESATERVTLCSSSSNLAYKWFDIDMSNFSAVGNLIDVEWDVGESEIFAGSNDFKITTLGTKVLSGNFDTFSGEVDIYIEDRSAGTLLSNKVTVSTSTPFGDILIVSANSNDAFLKIEATSGSPGYATGWITLLNSVGNIIPTIDGVISKSPKTNGAFSTANIFENYWQDDRVSRNAKFNDEDYIFDGTQYNLQRKPININLSTIPEPLYGFNDGTRIAKIDKWTRNLDTDYYKMYLIYQEDE